MTETTVSSGAQPWALRGQQRAVAVLRGAVARGEVGHAWAFLGAAGVGQQAAARSLAAALNCSEQSDACGQCAVCEASMRGAHSGVWEFAPTGPMHRVSEVREEWIPTAFRSATGGGWKVLYIAEADRMNEAAANAFLKVLEEPPSHTVWVLQVTDPLELPDTVLSRCRALPFTAWGPAELDTEARQLGLDDPDERTLAVRACLGAPTRLHRLAGGGLDAYRFHRGIPGQLRSQGPAYSLVAAKAIDEEVKRHTAATKAEGKRELDELTTVYGDDVPKAVSRQVADRASRRERELRTEVVRAALDDVVAWYRDCLLVEAGGPVETAINHDAGAELFAEAEPLGPTGLLRAVDLVLETRDRLESNVQQSLALEALFMQLSALTRGG